ncbi:methyl-accepting chemotaxis protein [Pseudoalteromonas sp. ZZD1]|uniref:methyl-accepting chemotaxis protein n=1 Tax=Pseudoalteromonas sp. ZZD1 TaxID=3139395 RepID=UPI003BA9747F
MSFLTNYKIKTRILALVLIPLLITGLMSVEKVRSSLAQQQAISKLDAILDYAHVTYPLISSLLEEGFYTRLYLDSASDKQLAQQQMVAYRQKALTNASQFKQFITENQHTIEQFPTLHSQVEIIKKQLSDLQIVRLVADEKNHLSQEYMTQIGREIHTMYEINNLIRKLLMTLSEMVVIASSEQQLGKMSNAYYYLVASSVERSFHDSFINTASNTQLDVYIYGEIFRSATAIQTYNNLFYNFATVDAQSAFTQMKQNADYLKSEEVALQARTNIYKTVNKPLNIEGTHWPEVVKNVSDIQQRTIEIVLKELIDTKNNLIDQAHTQLYSNILTLAVQVLFLALFSWFIIHSITLPLSEIVADVSKLARTKNLTYRFNHSGQDELNELTNAFNLLLSSFHSTLTKITEESQQISQSSDTIHHAIQDSTSLSNNQQLATHSISVAINQMTATISEVSTMTNRTHHAIEQAHILSTSNLENSNISQTMMQQLSEELSETTEIVTELDEQAQMISNILNVIEGIAEQTNLLALNAAIEAARAGTTGRGFAVVADEVRNLASRTQQSTKQIQGQINALQNGATTATQSMSLLQEKSNQAIDNVINNTHAFTQLKEQLDQVIDMALQIATATKEQTSVSNAINKQITLINTDAQSVASTTQSSQQTVDNLTGIVENLESYINEFTLVKPSTNKL